MQSKESIDLHNSILLKPVLIHVGSQCFIWQQVCAAIGRAGRAGMWHPNVYPNLHFIARRVISWILEVSTCEHFITAILPSQYKYKFIEIDTCNIHTHGFKCSFKIKLENEMKQENSRDHGVST